MRKRKDPFSLSVPMRIPNPQDPYNAKSDLIKAPFNILRISPKDQKVKKGFHGKIKSVSCDYFTTSENLTGRSSLSVQQQRAARESEERKIHEQEELLKKYEKYKIRTEVAKIVDTFFLHLNTNIINNEIEDFLIHNVNCNNVIYWEDIPSLKCLYSSKYRITVGYNESIAGSVMHEKKIKCYSVCGQHQKWSQKIDGHMIKESGPVILFQLRDYDGAVSGVVEIQKKFADPEMSQKDYQLFRMLQKRFTLMSRFIYNSDTSKQIIEMGKLMTIEQFIAIYSMKMNEIFNCSESEIWDFSDKQNPIVYRNGREIKLNNKETGVTGYIYSKRCIYNSLSSKRESSYVQHIDGTNDRPFIGIPIDNIVIVLRGNVQKQLFNKKDERILSYIAPYISSFYKNSLKYSEKPTSQPGLNLLSGMSSFLPAYDKKRELNGMLEAAMGEIQKMTSSDRITFFKIKNNALESVFLTGCQDSIKLKIGEGIAGHVAETGIEMNLSKASDSEYFQKNIDALTGYQTNSMLTVPIISTEGTVKGIIQLINKTDGMPFTHRDSLIATIYGSLCIFMILNASLLEENNDLKNRIKMISEAHITIDNASNSLNRLCNTARKTIGSKAATAFLYDAAKGIVEKAGFDGIYHSNYKGTGAIKYCLDNNKSVMINDTFHDPLIDQESDKGKRSILIVPIIAAGEQIGALEAVNKSGPFDDIDLYTLTCISNILSTEITAKSMMDVIRHGRTQLLISHFITKEERGKSIIPAFFSKKVSINTLMFESYDMDKNQLISTIFEIFNSLKILEPIECNALFSFINTVEKSYSNISYHSWRKAVSVTQLMYIIINSTPEMFNNDEKLSLIIASILSSVGHDGTDDAYHKRLETVNYITAGDSPVHDHYTATKALYILNKYQNSILPSKSAESIKKKVICLLVSKYSVDSYVKELMKYVNENQFDINSFRHKKVFMRCLFNMALYDEFCRSTRICEKWENKYSLERFELGKKEVEADLTYSSRHNCKELYSKLQSINESLKEEKDLFSATCNAMGNQILVISQIKTAYEENVKFFSSQQN